MKFSRETDELAGALLLISPLSYLRQQNLWHTSDFDTSSLRRVKIHCLKKITLMQIKKTQVKKESCKSFEA